MANIGIVNYGAGNIFSLTAALKRLGLEFGMINNIPDFNLYSHIIIPGVGHAGVAMDKLVASGLADEIPKITKPVLGICVGMQLLTAFSEEGNKNLLNIAPLDTLNFKGRIQHKVPHMGWNRISPLDNNPLFKDIKKDAYFYFVHSYFIEYNPKFTAAFAVYGIRFSAALHRDNFFGVQFHPEKSGTTGEQLLMNFANLSVNQ
ncbi:glutamine amidotransferase [bacterium A37T11]|nr:glutamine amidotransferase [bacterium A37T11]